MRISACRFRYAMFSFSIVVGMAAIPRSSQAQIARSNTWNAAQQTQPSMLAARLANLSAAKPVILQVGFNALYRSKHIPGSIYAGPASTPTGIAMLKKAVSGVPKNSTLYIYCGCCPIGKCPNIHPAFETLRAMGFTHVQVLMLETSFGKDWVAHGYPVAGEAVSTK